MITIGKKQNWSEIWGYPPRVFFPIIPVLPVNSVKAGGGSMEVRKMNRQKTTITGRESFPNTHTEGQAVSLLVLPQQTILKRTWICSGLFDSLYLLLLQIDRNFFCPSCDSILNSQESIKSSGSICIVVVSDWEIASQLKTQWKY